MSTYAEARRYSDAVDPGELAEVRSLAAREHDVVSAELIETNEIVFHEYFGSERVVIGAGEVVTAGLPPFAAPVPSLATTGG